MDIKKIQSSLDRLFVEERHRIVFWPDPQQEFLEVLPQLVLDGITIINQNEVGTLKIKVQLEQESPDTQHLIYSPQPEPNPKDDWLLDIRLYSRTFRADRASILLDELGLSKQSLRQHLSNRQAFLNNKHRLNRLTKLVGPDDSEEDLDRKMVAVVIKSEQADLFPILTTIFHSISEEADATLDTLPPAWSDIEKFGLEDSFWVMCKDAFGYSEATPSLKNILIRLMVTDFSNALSAPLPEPLQHLLLPKATTTNATVCLAQWRDSSTKSSSYDLISAWVSKALNLSDHLGSLGIDDLLDVMTFLDAEKHIASSLRDRVVQTADIIDKQGIQEIAIRRQDAYWATTKLSPTEEAPRTAYNAIYNALIAASNLFNLRNQYKQGFQFSDPTSLFKAYQDELYQFDQLYRHFCEYAKHARSEGWDILKSLRQKVEDCYGNWFILNLGLKWGELIENQNTTGLLENWRLSDTTNYPNQHRFFYRNVQPILDKKANRKGKAFVIVSDAFRYEVAEELTSELNGRFRFQAELSSLLGVLPSYTSLGMASLLPHKKLSYKENGDVLVDGMPTSSLDQRSKILEAVEGVAIKSDELLIMKQDAGRDFIRSKRVIYVYHNTIDAIGDSASTEADTFDGVRRALEELSVLVRHIVNKLNGTNVFVTADHGFLFQESPPDLTHKSTISDKPEGTTKSKKRYLLGHSLPDNEKVYHGSTASTAKADGDMEFWVPKVANRFHFSGGAKFIHGGAMPQEIMVPVIHVKHMKGKAGEKTVTKLAQVSILGGPHKITTNRHRFQLIQTEAVTERIKPITLQIAVYDESQTVTNTETVTFGSTSGSMDDRIKWVSLSLQGGQYDRKKTYHLILRNAENSIEVQRTAVTIDLVFDNDF
jgi:uncharacterized protein (TIGR02687 family)